MVVFNFELKTYPDLPPISRPRVYIAARGKETPEVDGEKFIAVSGECYEIKEVNENVNRLIKELKEMKKRAEKFFDNEKQTRPKKVD